MLFVRLTDLYGVSVNTGHFSNLWDSEYDRRQPLPSCSLHSKRGRQKITHVIYSSCSQTLVSETRSILKND